MKKHLALGAVGLTLLTVTGGAFAAAGRFIYNSLRDMTDKQGHVYSAESQFSGDVKLYTVDGKYIGSYGTDGTENAPIVADVKVDGRVIHLAGAGRHELRFTSGEWYGYADLNYQTAAERAQWTAAHNKALGHEISLPGSSGSDDGWGTALGFFGSNNEGGLLTWRWTGVGKVRFLFKNKVARSGVANPITPHDAEALRQTISPAEFQEKVRATPPKTAVFEWTTNGATHQHTGYNSMPLTLPNGTKLVVEFLPLTPAPK